MLSQVGIAYRSYHWRTSLDDHGDGPFKGPTTHMIDFRSPEALCGANIPKGRQRAASYGDEMCQRCNHTWWGAQPTPDG